MQYSTLLPSASTFLTLSQFFAESQLDANILYRVLSVLESGLSQLAQSLVCGLHLLASSSYCKFSSTLRATLFNCRSFPPPHSPFALPVNALDMNYAVVVIGFIVVGAGLWFAIDARKWFHGPVINVDDSSASSETVSVNEKDMTEVKKIEDVN